MARDEGTIYRVNGPAVAAIKRGMLRKGWNNVRLAEAVGISKQAVGDILSLREKRSAHLADMLSAVDEPRYLALDLTEEEIALLDAHRRAKKALPKDVASSLVKDYTRDVDREIALHEKTAKREDE